MKTKIALFVLLLFALSLIAQTIVLPHHFVQVNSLPGTPIVLTNAAQKVKRVTFVGNKATRVPNTGTVYIGKSSVNDDQPIAILSGQSVSLLIPEGTVVNLGALYLDVDSASDGVMVIYEAP